ncbi:tail fiber domain-containing protein, partial [Parvibaculum sp.]|uniref:tail fiber domain-containing protein n=1 Tax=Parvibaculum sp. TaxID=2024848 RepID=UPI002B96D51B
ALAVLGLSSLGADDPAGFWQIESDAIALSTTWHTDFGSFHTRLRAETWWPYNKPIVLMGPSILYSADVTAGNDYVKAACELDPGCRLFVFTGLLPVAYWDATNTYIHGNASGYWAAGEMCIARWAEGVGRGNLGGVTVSPTTQNVRVGPGVPGAYRFEVYTSQSAATKGRVSNPSTNSAATAEQEVESSGGLLALRSFSSANDLIPNQAIISWGGSANLNIQANGASAGILFAVGGVNRVLFESAGNVVPYADNAISLGKSGARWSAVWSNNGTIQTSDARQKTNIASLDGALCWEFITRLNPVAYQWISGQTVVTIEDDPDHMVEEPVVEDIEVDDYEVEFAGGVAMRKAVRRVVTREAVDTFAVVDEAGEQVIEDGRPLFVQRVRTRQVPAKREVHTSRAGVRIHLGHLAQEVKAIMDDLEVDWALYVEDAETGELGLRPEYFIPIIIAAMQWKFTQLEAQIGGGA